MKKHTLEKIEELLCDELDTFGEKDSINNAGELQVLDTTLHAMKNLYKVMDEAEGGSSYRSGGNRSYYSRRGGSYADGSYRMYSRDGGSYDDGSYDDGSYEGGGSYRRGRDRMGRFTSRSGGDMVERLKDMMHETEDPTEKKELRQFIANVEHRG